MDYNHPTSIIAVNLSDPKPSPSSEHISTDIVLEDVSNGILSPLLYQMHGKGGRICDSETQTATDHTFSMIGEVLAMDTSKRLIYLKDNRTVSYKHLVVVSGLRHTVLGREHDKALFLGVLALGEALRVRKNISNLLPHFQCEPVEYDSYPVEHVSKTNAENHLFFKNICQVLSPSNANQKKTLDMALGGTEKRLYQLLL